MLVHAVAPQVPKSPLKLAGIAPARGNPNEALRIMSHLSLDVKVHQEQLFYLSVTSSFSTASMTVPLPLYRQ